MTSSRLPQWVRLFLMLFALLPALSSGAETVVIGSKKFTESYVLGEIAAMKLKIAGFAVDHRQGIGATGIVWNALKGGGIALYPEYTGTIGEELLKQKGLTDEQMRAALQKEGIGMSSTLGFNNTYALVVRHETADRLHLETISDLKAHPELHIGLSHEFYGRKDGWQPLISRYGLHFDGVTELDHGLSYQALVQKQIDVTDAYSTDAKIAEDNLVVLQDDLGFFPQYKAVFLYRLDLPAKAVAALNALAGTIDDRRMTELNAAAEKSKNYAAAAALYFGSKGGSAIAGSRTRRMISDIAVWTLQHLILVVTSLLLAIVVGVPLGIVASRPGLLSQTILSLTGVIQTIPSLALLALLVPIPFLGINRQTAILALFLYSLLPIVRNTAVGLQEISGPLRESAAALGLEPGAQLWKIYLPMASPTILAGIKTSAIINVGTATLAALIGAGGLGSPIVSGLNLNDNATILEGAIPAAVLALLVQFGFDLLDRLLIPRGLRLAVPSANPVD